MIERIRRGIPAYQAELADGVAMFPDTIRDDPVLVELQAIACQSAGASLTPAQKADVATQVTLRAEYLRAAALVAAAIVEDTVAALAAAPARPVPESFDAPPISVLGAVASDAFTPVGLPIESTAVGVEAAAPINPADPSLMPAEPRRRGRAAK